MPQKTIFFLLAVLTAGIFSFFIYHNQTTQRTPGYIGVKISAAHPGIMHTKQYVETTLNTLLAKEVRKRIPTFKGELPEFYYSRNRFHTTVAYLCEPTREQYSVIDKELAQLTASGVVSSNTALLTNHLDLFGKNRDTIVITLDDHQGCLKSLHTACEQKLGMLTDQYPNQAWYTPWKKIGDFIPHISIARISFHRLTLFIEEHGGNTDNLVEDIRHNVLQELCTPFKLPAQNDALECSDLTLITSYTLLGKKGMYSEESSHPTYHLAT